LTDLFEDLWLNGSVLLLEVSEQAGDTVVLQRVAHRL